MKKNFALAFLLTAALALPGCCPFSSNSCCKTDCAEEQAPKPFAFPVPERAEGQTDVLGLRVAPIKDVRVAIIGTGARGGMAVDRMAVMTEGATIVAISDPNPNSINNAKRVLKKRNYTKFEPKIYTGAEDWKKICEDPNVDLVYICTNWANHFPIALYAMEHGKHVATEVPAALTVEQCWQLVDAAERNRVHCQMVENCNYDFFEMAVLNMVQQGKFGEVMHVEGAYIHDLRDYTYMGYVNDWRLHETAPHNGSIYPTHGIGPVSHILNIHRGDKMNTLVSMSTAAVGNDLWKEKNAERVKKRNPENMNVKWTMGDMNNTLIRTAKGKTILIQHDVTSPRPYDRLFKISGTKGYAQKYPNEGLAFEPNAHGWLSDKDKRAVLDEYKHPIVKEIGEMAQKVGGHGGMDFIMDYRLIYCLNNGLPLDQDVYDAAEWSCLIPLSEKSINLGCAPVEVPDFTRGAWKKLDGVKYHTVANPHNPVPANPDVKKTLPDTPEQNKMK